MNNPVKTALSGARRRPLAASVATLFALAAPQAFAATWHVTSCADSGAGSLRSIIVNNASSGDTVDFSQLNSTNCPSSTISLTTGAITIGEKLTLAGPLPPNRRITISGYYNGAYQNDRLINHTMPSSTLYVNNLNFEYSKFSPAAGDAKGACIYSAGSVNLDNVLLFHCQASSSASGTHAKGGGVYAQGNLTMKYSRITGNSVAPMAGAFAPAGGGVYVGGILSASYSTIDDNNAQFGNGGGIFVAESSSSTTISSSTISGNTAGSAAGVFVTGANLTVTNSTISGNHSSGYMGGLATASHSTTIQNSTIAFNTAANATPDNGPGMYIFGATAAALTVNLQSSILSNNTYGTTENDFGARNAGGGGFSITSNNNLIRAAPGSIRPATVSTACPLFGPLRDNGGPTLTHALLSFSPAIDTGNNNANLNEDQRGRPFVDPNNPYPYSRQSGIAPDIGSYEAQQADIIFNTSFEGCPALF